MSNEGSPYALGWSEWARKTPLMAMDNEGITYGFWLYPDTVDEEPYHHVYFNLYDNGEWGTEDAVDIVDDYTTYHAFSINALADPNGDIHLAISMKKYPLDSSFEVYHCAYDVSEEEWSDLEIVSEPLVPNGNNSLLPYLAFSGDSEAYEMHVVWEEHASMEKQVCYRKYSSSSYSWDTEFIVNSPNAEKPCVATTSTGDVHVVWEDIEDSRYWIYYKYYDASEDEWSDVLELPDNEDLNYFKIPTIVSDRWDNLHVVGIAEVDSLDEEDDYEAYYCFYDAPPHVSNLQFLSRESDEDSVVISWTGKAEPDLDTYEVYHKFTDQRWELAGSTTNTRFADTSASYILPCYELIPTYYYVKAIDDAEQATYSDTIHIFCVEGGKIVTADLSELFEFQNNFPNPFNAFTTIRYDLAISADVQIEIYDILGRRVETLVSGFQQAGSHSVTWNAGDKPSGIYFYRISAGEFIQTERMTLIK